MRRPPLSMLVGICVVGAAASACVEPLFEIPEAASSWASPELVAQLAQEGMVFHGGSTPPDVSGVYLLDEASIIRHDDDEMVGRLLLESLWTLWPVSDEEVLVSAEEEEGPLSFQDLSAAMTGEEDCFTLFFREPVAEVPAGGGEEEEEEPPCPQDQWFILSGCLEPGGIGDLRIADELRRFATPDGRCVTESEGLRVVAQDFVERVGELEELEDPEAAED